MLRNRLYTPACSLTSRHLMRCRQTGSRQQNCLHPHCSAKAQSLTQDPIEKTRPHPFHPYCQFHSDLHEAFRIRTTYNYERWRGGWMTYEGNNSHQFGNFQGQEGAFPQQQFISSAITQDLLRERMIKVQSAYRITTALTVLINDVDGRMRRR